MSNTEATQKQDNTADLANTKLVTQALAVGAKTSEAEFALLEPFAKLLTSGKLSVRGFKATIEAIEARGGYLATLKASHAQYIVSAWELSKLAEAPRNIAELCKLAHNMSANLDKAKVAKLEASSKVEAISKIAEASVKQGKTFEQIRKATPKPKQAPRGGRPNDGVVESVKLPALEAKAIQAWTKQLVTINKVAKVTGAELEALVELHAVLSEIVAK